MNVSGRGRRKSSKGTRIEKFWYNTTWRSQKEQMEDEDRI